MIGVNSVYRILGVMCCQFWTGECVLRNFERVFQSRSASAFEQIFTNYLRKKCCELIVLMSDYNSTEARDTPVLQTATPVLMMPLLQNWIPAEIVLKF